DSTCTGACGAGLTFCASECVDLSTDEAHCGDCDTACAASEVCVLGSCEDIEPLGVFHTTAYDGQVRQDLLLVSDYTFETMKVNPVTFTGGIDDASTVIDYAVVPDGSVVLVAAQDTEGVYEL